MSDTGNNIAPPGAIYVCGACGKTSGDQFGTMNASPGWDESCMLHAVLCDFNSLKFSDDGDRWRVTHADPYVPKTEGTQQAHTQAPAESGGTTNANEDPAPSQVRTPRRMQPNRDSRPIVLEHFTEHDETPECSIELFPYVKACQPVEKTEAAGS